MSTTDLISNQPPGRKHVLVVEDETSLREVLARYLERQGFHVETASDGAQGLKKLIDVTDPSFAFELLITDINMPEMGGIELIRAVRNRQLRVKIIACSSAFTEESLDELKKLSVDAMVPKMVLSSKLLSVMSQIMP